MAQEEFQAWFDARVACAQDRRADACPGQGEDRARPSSDGPDLSWTRAGFLSLALEIGKIRAEAFDPCTVERKIRDGEHCPRSAAVAGAAA